MADEAVGDAGESTIPDIGGGGEPDASSSTGGTNAGGKPDTVGADVAKLNERISNLLEQVSKTQSEKDKAFARLEQLEKNQKELADKTQTQSQRESYEAAKRKIIERVNQGWDGETAVELLERAIIDAERGAISKVDPKINALEAQLAEMKQLLASQHPERMKYRDRIDELRKELPNFDDDHLLTLAKREAMKAKRSAEPAPGTTATHRGSDIGSEAKLSPEQRALILKVNPKATEAEMLKVAQSLAGRKGGK